MSDQQPIKPETAQQTKPAVAQQPAVAQPVAKPQQSRSKIRRVVDSGKIYITATFNNTLVTITDEKGTPIVISSCGMHGFTGTRKSTPYAGTVTTEAAIKKATEEYGLRTADIFIKGIGPGREASLRAVRASVVDVNKIVDVTPIPHNGVRPPKIRRV